MSSSGGSLAVVSFDEVEIKIAPEMENIFGDVIKCSICLSVLRNPSCGMCGHTFCKNCIVKCRECPLCRKSLGQINPSVLVADMINKLTVVCNFCGKPGPYGEFEQHFKNVCMNVSMKCRKCDAIFMRNAPGAANHADTCPKETVPCGNFNCGESVPRENMTTHSAGCPYRFVVCACKTAVPSREIAEHMYKCAAATKKRWIFFWLYSQSVFMTWLKTHQSGRNRSQ